MKTLIRIYGNPLFHMAMALLCGVTTAATYLQGHYLVAVFLSASTMTWVSSMGRAAEKAMEDSE